MATLRTMKENKLPVWVKGMSWDDYETKFLACMSTRADGYKAVTGEFLEAILADDLKSDKEISDEERGRMKAENERAYHDLIATLPHGAWLRKVKKAESSVYGGKCAASAWSALRDIIREEVDLDSRDLKNKFDDTTELDIRKKPAEHRRKLEDLRDELKYMHDIEKTDLDIIEQIFKVLPEEYNGVRDALESSAEPLTITRVKEALKIKYSRLMDEMREIRALRNKRKKKKRVIVESDSSDSDSEQGLAVDVGYATQTNISPPTHSAGYQPNNVQTMGQTVWNQGITGGAQVGVYGMAQNRNFRANTTFGMFRGRCNHCGEWGHMARHCPHKDNNGGRMVRTACEHCGKDTHPSHKCWELEENARFRPANWMSIRDPRRNIQGGVGHESRTMMVSNVQRNTVPNEVNVSTNEVGNVGGVSDRVDQESVNELRREVERLRSQLSSVVGNRVTVESNNEGDTETDGTEVEIGFASIMLKPNDEPRTFVRVLSHNKNIYKKEKLVYPIESAFLMWKKWLNFYEDLQDFMNGHFDDVELDIIMYPEMYVIKFKQGEPEGFEARWISAVMETKKVDLNISSDISSDEESNIETGRL